MSSQELVLITGANTGLGYETIKALFQSSKSRHVLLGCRTESKGKEAEKRLKEEVPESVSTVEVLQIDVTEDESIHKAVAYIKEKFGKLDVLINNAGTQFDGLFDSDIPTAREIFNNNFNTNVSSQHVLTLAAAPLLIAAKSARLVFLASGTASLIGNADALFPPWAPNPPVGWPKGEYFLLPGYRASKAAVNMLMLMWYWLLKEDGVKTFSVSPGFLATGLGNAGPEKLKSMGAKDPATGGNLMRQVIEGERDDDVGKVVTQDGALQDW